MAALITSIVSFAAVLIGICHLITNESRRSVIEKQQEDLHLALRRLQIRYATRVGVREPLLVGRTNEGGRVGGEIRGSQDSACTSG